MPCKGRACFCIDTMMEEAGLSDLDQNGGLHLIVKRQLPVVFEAGWGCLVVRRQYHQHLCECLAADVAQLSGIVGEAFIQLREAYSLTLHTRVLYSVALPTASSFWATF